MDQRKARGVTSFPPPGGGASGGEKGSRGGGGLVEKKGFDVVVDACGELDRRGVPFEAVIVGPDDDAGPKLRARIAELGLEGRIRLEGQMSQAELYDEYRRASAFCLPCRILDNGDRDGIPNVLAQALAAGAPVVTTPTSGPPLPPPRHGRPRRQPERARRGDGSRSRGRHHADLRDPRDRARRRQRAAR